MQVLSETATSSGTGSPVLGIRSDIYERRWELIWMTKDDIDTFEARLGDQRLFQNIALLLLSASVPLAIEKGIDYSASSAPSDLAILIVCIGAAVMGGIFQILAISRRSKVASFKSKLFKEERRLSSHVTMIDSSDSTRNLQTALG